MEIRSIKWELSSFWHSLWLCFRLWNRSRRRTTALNESLFRFSLCFWFQGIESSSSSSSPSTIACQLMFSPLFAFFFCARSLLLLIGESPASAPVRYSPCIGCCGRVWGTELACRPHRWRTRWQSVAGSRACQSSRRPTPRSPCPAVPAAARCSPFRFRVRRSPNAGSAGSCCNRKIKIAHQIFYKSNWTIIAAVQTTWISQ